MYFFLCISISVVIRGSFYFMFLSLSLLTLYLPWVCAPVCVWCILITINRPQWFMIKCNEEKMQLKAAFLNWIQANFSWLRCFFVCVTCISLFLFRIFFLLLSPSLWHVVVPMPEIVDNLNAEKYYNFTMERSVIPTRLLQPFEITMFDICLLRVATRIFVLMRSSWHFFCLFCCCCCCYIHLSSDLFLFSALCMLSLLLIWN